MTSEPDAAAASATGDVVDDPAPTTGDAVDESGAPTEEHDAERDPEKPATESLGWRGWVLVGALVVSLVVVPWTIVALPRAQGFLASLGLGLRDAYLVLPMLPALGLGILAVWAAVAARRAGD